MTAPNSDTVPGTFGEIGTETPPRAIAGPNFTTHRRSVSYETSTPRSSSTSSMARKLSEKRR